MHIYIHEWRKITSDPVILGIVQHCHLDIDEDNNEHLFHEEIEYVFSKEEQDIICCEIDKWVDLKVIKETQRQVHHIISRIFLTKKKNGEYRMVINLEKLNKHIAYKHFKMENFEEADRLINKGDYMASVDLRHAYYSIQLKLLKNSKSIFVLNGRGKFTSSLVLPMGFQKVLDYSLN